MGTVPVDMKLSSWTVTILKWFAAFTDLIEDMYGVNRQE